MQEMKRRIALFLHEHGVLRVVAGKRWEEDEEEYEERRKRSEG